MRVLVAFACVLALLSTTANALSYAQYKQFKAAPTSSTARLQLAKYIGGAYNGIQVSNAMLVAYGKPGLFASRTTWS